MMDMTEVEIMMKQRDMKKRFITDFVVYFKGHYY